MKAFSNEGREFKLSNNDILTLDDLILLTKKFKNIMREQKKNFQKPDLREKEFIVHLKKKKKKEFHLKQRKLNVLTMMD